MPKVFIYSDKGTGPNCSADTKELFEAYGVHDRPDVAFVTFDENFDGLDPKKDTVTTCIPGGSVNAINDSFTASRRKNMNSLLERGANYAGFCAGSYFALDTEIYATNYELQLSLTFPNPTRYEYDWIKNIRAFNFSQEYRAIGPFFPENVHYAIRMCSNDRDCTPEILNTTVHKPYVTSLTFGNQNVPALYAGGCGFEKISEGSSFDVVATYPNTHTFEIPAEKRKKTLSQMPAIMSKKPNEKSGGVFLSGLHVEVLVKDSKLVRFFHPESKNRAYTVPLKAEEVKTLEKEREKLEAVVIPAMKSALNTS